MLFHLHLPHVPACIGQIPNMITICLGFLKLHAIRVIFRPVQESYRYRYMDELPMNELQAKHMFYHLYGLSVKVLSHAWMDYMALQAHFYNTKNKNKIVKKRHKRNPERQKMKLLQPEKSTSSVCRLCDCVEIPGATVLSMRHGKQHIICVKFQCNVSYTIIIDDKP